VSRWPLVEPDVQISRIRLSCEQVTRSSRWSQVLQTEVAKMRIKTHTVGHTIPTLTATTQMNPQTLLHVMVEIPVGLAGMAETEVGRPSVETPIQILE